MIRPAAAVRTSAPVRLDLAGAWTDVAPFATEARGVVVNAALELRTHVELEPQQDRYRLRADDLGDQVEAMSVAGLAADGRLDLLKAVIRRSGIGPCSLRTTAAAPPGSGLGSSGALAVALVYAIAASRGEQPSAIECAEEAWEMETIDAAVPGGRQDQYAAAVGGIQHLVFDHGVTRARPLDVEPAFADELAAHTVVCYTGRSRFSGDTITRVMRAYADGDRVVVGALHALSDLGDAMADAMTRADLAAVARLLSANWQEQQKLDRGMCTPEMARLEAAMFAAGATGGKAAGAGAGGSMFFVVPGDVIPAVAAARQSGAAVLPVVWARHGVMRE